MDNLDGLTVWWKQPSHPKLVHISKGTGRGSSAISLVSLPAGAHFATLEAATPCAQKSWTSVQCSLDGSNVEFNSDLVYLNHSCRPSLVIDMSKFEVRVVDDRPLKEGDELSFSYNSTEWEMAEPFVCECSGKDGKGCGERVAGAKYASAESLKHIWLNLHIQDLLTTNRPGIWSN